MFFTSSIRASYLGSMVAGGFPFYCASKIGYIIRGVFLYSNEELFFAEPLLDVLHIVHNGFLHEFYGCGSVFIRLGLKHICHTVVFKSLSK